ncbi:uncharacterized protein LOC143685204 [Tamandua tetradactyla]|uniref:uncharacterized protein LOC143685204 n=1 Tax=Tamandua tetradactyla TaxID=48850 RepID=UPI004053E5E0
MSDNIRLSPTIRPGFRPFPTISATLRHLSSVSDSLRHISVTFVNVRQFPPFTRSSYDNLRRFPTVIVAEKFPTFAVGISGCPKMSDICHRVLPLSENFHRSPKPFVCVRKSPKHPVASRRKSDNFRHASLLFVTVRQSPSLNVVLYPYPTIFADFPCSPTISAGSRGCLTIYAVFVAFRLCTTISAIFRHLSSLFDRHSLPPFVALRDCLLYFVVAPQPQQFLVLFRYSQNIYTIHHGI